MITHATVVVTGFLNALYILAPLLLLYICFKVLVELAFQHEEVITDGHEFCVLGFVSKPGNYAVNCQSVFYDDIAFAPNVNHLNIE